MPITVVRLWRFEGPNIVSPHPGVLLEARANRDLGAALRNAIKDVGQQIGMVIARLEIQTWEIASTFHHRASFATPTPGLGKAAVQFILDGLQARERGSEWDADEQVEALQERRLAEALPLAALQLVVEANRRGVPTFRRADGMLQIGYGARGHALDLQAIPFDQRRDGERLMQTLPWESLGSIPIIALSGSVDMPSIAGMFAMTLPDRNIGALENASFDAARQLLAQPNFDLAILGLAPAGVLHTGLPFNQCTIAVIGAPPQHLPESRNEGEIARAVALPMLVATHQTIIATPSPLLAELAPSAESPVTFVEAGALAQTLAELYP